MAEPLQDRPPEVGTESKRETHPDLEAQDKVIESLRSQIQDLLSQVTQLNGKLVSSYDRVSQLEDQLHDSSKELRSASVKISQLELERSKYLSGLNSGLPVEQTHVTAEPTRMTEKVTEGAARRGGAESAKILLLGLDNAGKTVSLFGFPEITHLMLTGFKKDPLAHAQVRPIRHPSTLRPPPKSVHVRPSMLPVTDVV